MSEDAFAPCRRRVVVTQRCQAEPWSRARRQTRSTSSTCVRRSSNPPTARTEVRRNAIALGSTTGDSTHVRRSSAGRESHGVRSTTTPSSSVTRQPLCTIPSSGSASNKASCDARRSVVAISSSASRKTTIRPRACANPLLRAADTPAPAPMRRRTRSSGGMCLVSVSDEPSSTTMTSSAIPLCASAETIASRSIGPGSRAGITTLTSMASRPGESSSAPSTVAGLAAVTEPSSASTCPGRERSIEDRRAARYSSATGTRSGRVVRVCHVRLRVRTSGVSGSKPLKWKKRRGTPLTRCVVPSRARRRSSRFQ